MAKLRNPRFAPEFLERRLQPSVSFTTAALVAGMDDPEPLDLPTGPAAPLPVPPPPPPVPVLPY